MIGCPPGYDLVLDWYATLKSITLRRDRVHEKEVILGLGEQGDCYDGTLVCMWARSIITLYLEIFDSVRHLI